MSYPLVSIGMPIRNEEVYIDKSLDSLLNQDYPNTEIIISDNASTDSTSDICKEYEAKYSNVQYIRLAENIGSAANFQYVLEQGRGKYFMWAAGHDLWSENLVGEAVALLEKDESIVLAFGTPYWVDSNSKALNKYTGWLDTRGLDLYARYFITFWGSMNPVLSVIRTETLKKCGGFKPIVGADLVVLTALSLEGTFAHAVNTAWYRREYRAESEYREKLKRYVGREYGQSRGIIGRLFPLGYLPFNLLQTICQSRLSFIEKSMLFLTVVLNMPARMFSGYRSNKK